MPDIRPSPGAMHCHIAPEAFPGEGFSLGYPESIGDTARSVWFGLLTPEWTTDVQGRPQQLGEQPDELRYELTLVSGDDWVEARYTLTNLSDRTWAQSHAFNCCQCGGAPSIRDHDAVRHYVGLDGEPVPLRSVPRVFSPRATVQLYSVAGQPPGHEIPFVAGFQATPDVALEGWMAIVSADGRRLVATVSRPALYLFQNLEYSCIHSACSFGRLAPGESAQAINRTYYVESSLDDWYARMRDELGGNDG